MSFTKISIYLNINIYLKLINRVLVLKQKIMFFIFLAYFTLYNGGLIKINEK